MSGYSDLASDASSDFGRPTSDLRSRLRRLPPAQLPVIISRPASRAETALHSRPQSRAEGALQVRQDHLEGLT